MQTLNLDTHPVDVKALKKRRPTDEDYDQVVGGNFDAYQDGELVISMKDLGPCPDLLAACKGLKFVKDYRTSGMYTVSRIFGFRPREPLRKDFCSIVSLAREEPHGHTMLCRYADEVDSFYREKVPEIYKDHLVTMEEVDDRWRLGDTVFTSGIVNKNNPLFFHKDQGNFNKTWNGMITMPHDIAGGRLVIPKYRIAVEFERPSIIIFDARNTLHGVTNIRPMNPRGFRYTIVYYSLQGMTKCGTRAEELTRIRKLKTEREMRRHSSKRKELEEKVNDAGGVRLVGNQNVVSKKRQK